MVSWIYHSLIDGDADLLPLLSSRHVIDPVWEGIGLRLRMELCGRVVAALSWHGFAVFCYHDGIVVVPADI